MAVWHGYIGFQKHAALTDQEWRAVLLKLRAVLNHLADDASPARRLHYRQNLAQTGVIVEAAFNVSDIDIEDLDRLAKYIQEAIPRFTVQQVRNNMRDLWHLFGGLNATWAESGALARQYIANHAAEWDPEQ